MEGICSIILAAGEGTRMKSKLPKVLHKLDGKPMIDHVIDAAKSVNSEKVVIVIGHGADKITEVLGDSYSYALQEQQLGTGHAVMEAISHIPKDSRYTLLLCGDTPLITSQSIEELTRYHIQNNNGITLVTSFVQNPHGYGRIVRDQSGAVKAVIEEKDATDEQRKIREINGGMYCFDTNVLLDNIKNLSKNNCQGEYYLTDLVEMISNKGIKVDALAIDESEIMGVNNRYQLSQAAQIMRKRNLHRLMMDGITIINPENTYIDSTVSIGQDTVIYPGTIIEGNCVIGEDCVLGPNVKISNTNIGNGVKIEYSVIVDSTINDKASVGPFAYLRPGSSLGKNVKIGDFVEVKNSVIGDNSKAAHLSYLGDCDIGENVNIGCGVVVVNYDGSKKHRSTIEDNAFVGCNANLVSPVKIEKGSYVAAGSTITEDVPKDSLALGRARQVNKEGWVAKRKNNVSK